MQDRIDSHARCATGGQVGHVSMKKLKALRSA
jgi:hypothetical protein